MQKLSQPIRWQPAAMWLANNQQGQPIKWPKMMPLAGR